VLTPPQPAAVVDVIVTNPDGQKATLPAAFTYTLGLKPPKIAAVTPATDFVKGGSQVTITGTGFTPGTVTFGTTAATIVAASATQLLVTVPPHAPGVVDVTVTNIDGVSNTLLGAFNYVAPPANAPAPVLTSVFPTSGANLGGTPVSITGANFQAGVQVLFGGVPATFVSFNVGGIVVNTPPHGGGFVDVTVVNADGQTATLAQAFQYVAPGPNINALNIHGSPMAGGQLVLIAGSGFSASSTVTFGGVPGTGISFDAVNNVLQVTTPPGPGGLEAFVNVTVANPDGQSSGFIGFHYGPPPNPTDFFSDVNGTKTLNNGKAGQVIDIIGTDFSVQPGRGVQVLFSGPSSGIGTVDTKLSTTTTLFVGIPKLNPGTYTIIVTSFDGQFKIAAGQLIILGP
jgi:hypothetical protein